MQLAVCQIRPFAEGLTVRDTFVQKPLADLLWKVFSPKCEEQSWDILCSHLQSPRIGEERVGGGK